MTHDLSDKMRADYGVRLSWIDAVEELEDRIAELEAEEGRRNGYEVEAVHRANTELAERIAELEDQLAEARKAVRDWTERSRALREDLKFPGGAE